MTASWWGKEASPVDRTYAVSSAAAPALDLQLVESTRAAVYRQVIARIASYAAEWTNRQPTDAGIALVHLFSEEMEPALQRLNQLPEKSFIEFLRTGGVQPLPPTPAEVLLQFTVSDAAPQSVSVPQGFQVGASPAGGGDVVIFETNSTLCAAPAKIEELYAFERGLYRPIDATKDDVPFQPFGRTPRPGLAFFIGLSADPDVSIQPQISLGIQVQGGAGQPPPVSTGGVVPLPAPLAPLLQWDVLNGVTYQQAEVISDETKGLLQSGVVTLQVPNVWNAGIPQGAPDTTPLLWVRLQIMYGAYPQPPVLLSVKLNMVRATAVRTIKNEVLTPETGGSVMSLSQVPVLPNSLQLVVDDTADLSFSSSAQNAAADSDVQTDTPTGTIWTQVDDLAEFGPADNVYALDPATGKVTFGDGEHGRVVPPGFRNVVARSYRVGGGSGGAVDAGKVANLINSIPFLSAVTNPLPATGGMDAETQEQAKLRGPKEIRARGRAVAVADYEVLALRATGARVARAHAVAGFHPGFPGKSIPGVVCVFVIPPKRGAGPPTPDEESLRAVSSYLSKELAPVGVEVVAAAPRYHRVRVEASVAIVPGVSRSDVVTRVLELFDKHLDPVEGGDDLQGWPFGGTLSYVALVRALLTDPGVRGVSAVSSLNFVVDGVRGADCADFPISPNSLVWAVGHQVIALGPGEEP